ncbi:MAG: hypothetical protein ACI4RP_06550 [Acutalibacteraceae bacterium]
MLEQMNALDRLSRATATSSVGSCRHLFLPETGTLLSATLTFPLTGEFPLGEGLILTKAHLKPLSFLHCG